jgi:hypothetical protein
LQDFFGFWVRSVGVRGGGGRDHSSNWCHFISHISPLVLLL